MNEFTNMVDVRRSAKNLKSYASVLSAFLGRLGERGDVGPHFDPQVPWLLSRVAIDRSLSSYEKRTLRMLVARSFEQQQNDPIIATADSACDFDRKAVEAISEDISTPDRPVRYSMLEEEGAAHRRLRAALRLLRQVWPQAAAECSLYIRRIIVLDSTDLTASHDQLFGLIFAGTLFMSDLPSAMEAVIHETGHHSMFLNDLHEDYVTNPDDLVSHPLRPDPRPVSGTLHAAFVLSRMTVGMNLLSEWPNVPSSVRTLARQRAQLNWERLDSTCEILMESARWTEAGGRLFRHMTSPLSGHLVAWD